MAERKDTTRDRLARAGLPVPRQIAVADAAAACAAATGIGYPVVVKPIDCSNARGVTIGNRTPEAVAAAFALARGFSRNIVVESQLPGDAFRLLVLDGRVTAAVRSAPGRVVGDGVRTLRDLVEEANAIPKRRRPRPLQRRISFTAEILAYLAERGLGPDSVPAAGRTVSLHWSGHGARGGSPVAVAGPIHPDNAAAAIQAARVIGLDIAGIDMVVPDIAASWRDTGGGICEVNRAPGFRYHLVADGADSPVLDQYLDHLLDRPGQPAAAGRSTIPILIFLGGRDLDEAAAATAGMMEHRGVGVGLATADRYSAAGLPLADPGPGSPSRLTRLVADPAVEAIVAVVPPATVLEHGLGHGRADLVLAADAAAAGIAMAAGVIQGLGAAPMPVAAVTDGRLLRWVEARYPAAVA